LLYEGRTLQGARPKMADFCSATMAEFYSAVDSRVADWQLALPNDVSIPISQVEEITRNARFNAELFACLCAGIVERKCADTRCNDEKLELFLSLIKERGALAPGSMR
ncbi:hypothetical protein, partial [Thalassovita mediterranea]